MGRFDALPVCIHTIMYVPLLQCIVYQYSSIHVRVRHYPTIVSSDIIPQRYSLFCHSEPTTVYVLNTRPTALLHVPELDLHWQPLALCAQHVNTPLFLCSNMPLFFFNMPLSCFLACCFGQPAAFCFSLCAQVRPGEGCRVHRHGPNRRGDERYHQRHGASPVWLMD